MAVTNANFSFRCRNSRRAELFKLNMDGHPNQTDRREDKCHDRQLRTLDRQAGIQTDRHKPATQTKLYTPLLFFVAVQTIHGGLHVRLVGRWGVAGIAHLTGRQCANVNSLEFRQVYVQIHTHNI